MARIQIEGVEVQALSPEGKTASMPLPEFMSRLNPRRIDSGDVIYPDGVKAARTEGGVTILVHETCPQVYSLKWIAPDSPAPYGKEAKYRTVRIGLPYLITLAVFRNLAPVGAPVLTEFNECFFRTGPLESLEDELLFPALLNCSKFSSPEGRPLSWICTQHLNLPGLAREPIPGRRVRQSLRALLHCLLETGFNYSSEQHEGTSWFTESHGVDPRVRTIEAWQEATTQDPLFPLEVPWLKTRLSLGQVLDRILTNLGVLGRATSLNSTGLARLVFNYKPAGDTAASPVGPNK